MPQPRISFGPYLLDLGRGMLFDGDTPIAVGSKGLALLQVLVEAHGEVVSKATLLDAAWPNAAVEESNLTVQVAQLRKRLGKSPDSEEWIATVPRVGYRFVGPLNGPADRPPELPSLDGQSPAWSKPSIAVLPFDNMSNDPEQAFFAEGLSEDLITDLSKVPGLLVIARNSSFAYKGKAIDVRTIGRELGVRYVIEGSVRRAAERVRINAQIVDATDQSHIWADRFDRNLADIFSLQDEIAGRIVSALAGALPSSQPIAPRRATNLEAYDLFVRGRVLSLHSPEGNAAARPLLEKSIALDPGFAEAYAWLAINHVSGWVHWGEPIEEHRAAAFAAAERAVTLDPLNADAHANLGYVLIFGGKPDEGARELATALRINPNHADAWTFSGEFKADSGEAAEGVTYIQKALRLNPHPPGWYYWILGLAQYAAGRYEDAVSTLRHKSTLRTGSQRILAASLAQLGRAEEARREAAEFIAMVPTFRIGQWVSTQPFKHEADRQHFIEGYLKAGLPM